MKIGIITITSPDSGGVYQYTLTMLEAFKKYLTNEYQFIQIKNKNYSTNLNKAIEIKYNKTSIITNLKLFLYFYTGIKFNDFIDKHNKTEIDKLDLIISPIITFLPYYFQKPYIITIHDFQHKYYPEFFTFMQRLYRNIVYKTAQKANIVVCESEYVKKDIMKFLKVPEEKIHVIQSPPPSYILNIKLSENNYKEIRTKYNLPAKYLFYPAQFWYHKNHINLIRAIKLIKNRYNESINLVLVGSKKNNFENVMNEIKNLSLQNQVKYLGYVPDEDMPYLYKLSTALVMPTLFESVSLPIWEAFYLGVPVVSSNVCALPEQVGDAGLLFNPHDVEDIAEKVYKIWTDESLREELINRGYERIKNLTLENYAKQWEEIIKEVIQNE